MKHILSLKFLAIALLLGASSGVYAQGNSTCANASPFCTGQNMQFPAQTNAGQAQAGPAYGCLFSQPNPNWFFFQAAAAGPMVISMSAQFDVDFICWGPFPTLASCGNLTAGNQVPGSSYQNPNSNGCSYSGSPTETLTIANAVPGQFYILLITNFSNQNQQISFNQTNTGAPGAGATNCGIICGFTVSASGPICPGGTATISAITATSVNTYTWIGPGGYSSPNLANVVSNVSATSVYTIQGATAASTCQAVTTISVIPFPTYVVTPPTTTVCQNGSFLAGAVIANPQNFSYQWLGPGGITFSSPNGSSSLVQTSPIFTPTAVLVYSVVITPTTLNCPLATTMSVRINNPPTPTLSPIPALCNISTQTVITANPGGGTFWGNPFVNSAGVVLPNTATAFGTFTVGYTYTLGACTTSNTANISISQYNTANLTSTLISKCVFDAPFNLMTIVQNTLGTWSGVNVAANTFTPAGLPTNTYVLTYFNPSTPYGNVCPASNTFSMAVFNPPTPTVTPIKLQCNTNPPIQMFANVGGATGLTGVWSGNNGISPNGLMTPSLSTSVPGVNTVVYTVGQGTCVASSSGTYHVSQFNTAALSSSFLNLCVTTNSFSLLTLVNSTVNGVWSGNPLTGFVPAAGANPPSYNPGMLPSIPTGTYPLTYNTSSSPLSLSAHPDLKNCQDTRQLTIKLLNPVKSFITPINTICNADGPIQLQVSANTGSFVPALYVSSSGVLTPSLTSVGANPVTYMVGTGTCNITDTKIINVEGFVPSTIVGTIPDQCNTSGVVNLMPLTMYTTGVWSGPGVLGTSFNPGVSGVGVLNLVYKTASQPSGLCPSQSSLAVNVFSLASPAVMQDGPYCNSHAPFKLIVSPLGGVFGSTNTHAVDANGWFNPAYANIGTNVVNYSVTSGPCVAYAQTFIKIEQFVSADFAKYIGPFCKNDPALDLNSIAQNPGGTWAGPGVAGTIFTPANANVGNTNLIIYRTHSLTDELCPDTSAMRVQINDVPKISIVRDVERGCTPVEVTFNTPNTNFGRAEWNLGDGSEPVEGLTASHTYTAPGTYSVVLNYWDDIGCTTQTVLTNALIAYPVPQASFRYEPDEVTIANPDVQFHNLTRDIGTSTYLWDMSAMYSTAEVNPAAQFTKAGEYRITLTATNIYGCKDVSTRIIEVKPDFSVYIPNTFTPNDDGLNDYFLPTFSPYGLDTRTFAMEIFDRWGVLIYQTKDYNMGWNGTMNNKGTDALKQEVYIYKIKFKDLEGRVYNKMGHVTLLR
jgi:gliding motility-associated-like protein